MGRSGYSTEERRAIANGQFFTAAELAASPYKRSLAAKFAAPATSRTDPNNRPMTAKRRAELDAMLASPVCGYCHEGSDDRSQVSDETGMHPECAEEWAAEVAARKATRQ